MSRRPGLVEFFPLGSDGIEPVFLVVELANVPLAQRGLVRRLVQPLQIASDAFLILKDIVPFIVERLNFLG